MIAPIDRTAPTPIFQQIQEWILAQITSGEWAENHKLKAEADLATQLGVSRGTIRKAIAPLLESGHLVQVHGRGTFVASTHIDQPLAESLVSFSEDLISRNIPFETRVIEKRVVVPSQRIRSLLQISEAVDTLYLRRVRVVRDKPIILLENYVRLDRCPGLEKYNFQKERLLEILEKEYGLPLDWARRTFEARLADSEVSQRLDIPESSAVMYINQLLYLENEQPIETSDLWLRGDHLRISAAVRRSRPSSERPPIDFKLAV